MSKEQSHGIQSWERWVLRITIPVCGALLAMIFSYVLQMPKEIAELSKNVAVVKERVDNLKEEFKNIQKDERYQRTSQRITRGSAP